MVNPKRINDWYFKTPVIENLELGVGYHIVTFKDLNQLINWFLDEKKCAVMDNKFIGKDVKSVYWVSVPLLLAKKSFRNKWELKFNEIFIPNKDESLTIYRKNEDREDPILFNYKSFEEYYEFRIKYKSKLKIKALEVIEKEKTTFFAICKSKKIEIKR